MSTVRSTNPVVRNAMGAAARNAASVRGGRYEVTLETVTFKGNTTSTAVMTDAQLKAWLGLVHAGEVYGEVLKRFAEGARFCRVNLDMHPTVYVRPM